MLVWPPTQIVHNPNLFALKESVGVRKNLKIELQRTQELILKTTLNIITKHIYTYKLEYELIAEGQECGDKRQIELDTTFSCPSRCSKLVLADKRCGEYFELRYDKKICRCLDKTQSCKRSGDKETFLYRVPKSKSQTRLLK